MAPKRKKGTPAGAAVPAAPAASGGPTGGAKGAGANPATDIVTRSKTAAQQRTGSAVASAQGAASTPPAAVDRGFEALEPWLSKTPLPQDKLVQALYRANKLGKPIPPLAEKGEATNSAAADAAASALGVPSPFVAVSLADRKGIWQSDPPIVRQLGEDPSKQFREVHVVTDSAGASRKAVAPAGLRNLGATCYLNSLLQYLFFNNDFRRHLLQAASGSEVVQALQRVFALMANGRRAAVDPSEFVRVTGVDAVEQEDATEFSTLLLDWLERALGDGGKDKSDGDSKSGGAGGGFIPRLFQGEVSQCLTCLEHPGHTFERKEAFLELRARLTKESGGAAAASRGAAGGKASSAPPPSSPTAAATPPPPPTVVDSCPPDSTAAAGAQEAAAPAAGPATTSKNRAAAGGRRREKVPPPPVRLEELLADTAFPDEMLDGSNKYDCPKCNRKVDARKSIRLARPPQYLHITVERYHYDLQKGERVKLNNPVSFPRELRLQHGASGSTAPTVEVYECIGYLEHVSDSAHSGHYTATLFQEDADAEDALALAADTDSQDSPANQGDEPLSKRRCAVTEAAKTGSASSPAARSGMWWVLDDLEVSPVVWQPGKTDAFVAKRQVKSEDDDSAPSPPKKPKTSLGTSSAVDLPERIESASAYLVLYRWRTEPSADDDAVAETPSSCLPVGGLPSALASWVAADNRTLCDERRVFQARSAAVQQFLQERRSAVDHLVRALREYSKKGERRPSDEQFAVVPTLWLQGFLHGEDRGMPELLSGETRPAPVTYWRALSRSPSGGHLLDPLAIWCGEVKLMPAKVLESLSGAGGLDSSLFITLDESMGSQVCTAALHLHKLYQKEWLLIRKILTDGKVSLAQAKQMHSEGKGDEVVWISQRVQRLWHRALGGVSAQAAAKAQQESSWEMLAFKAFLAEVQQARWGGRQPREEAILVDEAAAAADGGEPNGSGVAGGGAAEASSSSSSSAPAAPSSGSAEPAAAAVAPAPAPGTLPLDRCEVSLTAGIVCQHGLVCNTRAAFLARRADIVELLEISKNKGKAYTDLWPHVRAVPRIRAAPSSASSGRRAASMDEALLLGFSRTCAVCRGEGASTVVTQAAAANSSSRKMTVKRRYASKVVRKVGVISLPETEESISGLILRNVVRDQLKFPVARVMLDLDDEVELKDDVFLETWDEATDRQINTIIVEKDESTPPAREAAAFQGSIFRAASMKSST